jgi:hypothetical protein
MTEALLIAKNKQMMDRCLKDVLTNSTRKFIKSMPAFMGEYNNNDIWNNGADKYLDKLIEAMEELNVIHFTQNDIRYELKNCEITNCEMYPNYMDCYIQLDKFGKYEYKIKIMEIERVIPNLMEELNNDEISLCNVATDCLMRCVKKQMIKKLNAPEREKSEVIYETDNCPICLEPITDPYVGVCGHQVCIGCSNKLMKHKPKCPTCRESWADEDEDDYEEEVIRDVIETAQSEGDYETLLRWIDVEAVATECIDEDGTKHSFGYDWEIESEDGEYIILLMS